MSHSFLVSQTLKLRCSFAIVPSRLAGVRLDSPFLATRDVLHPRSLWYWISFRMKSSITQRRVIPTRKTRTPTEVSNIFSSSFFLLFKRIHTAMKVGSLTKKRKRKRPPIKSTGRGYGTTFTPLINSQHHVREFHRGVKTV